MKTIVSLIFCVVITLAITCLTILANNTPLITRLLPTTTNINHTKVKIKYYGTATLLFDDGTTQIMSDGFFSRPSVTDLLWREFSPNTQLLEQVVKQEKLQRLAAIFPVHSHHDHAMDSAPLAELTGAQVLGSQSTAYIAQGWGLPLQQIKIAENQQRYQYGDFSVRLIPSRHVAMPSFLAHHIGMGEKLKRPLLQPARMSDYKEGTSYSVHIQHPQASYLIQGSANYVLGALKGLNADTVFLGVAGLSGKTDRYIESYLKETVLAVKAKTVVPIHWESFTKPASNQTLPVRLDDIGGSLIRIKTILDKHKVGVKLMRIGQNNPSA